jgi:hypothetical protein
MQVLIQKRRCKCCETTKPHMHMKHHLAAHTCEC